MPTPYVTVSLKKQPIDKKGHPLCANLGCGLPIEDPTHWVDLTSPNVGTIRRCFCCFCYEALMEQGHASFY